MLWATDESLDPITVCPLGAETVMLEPHHIANLLEQFLFWLAPGRGCVYQRNHGCVLRPASVCIVACSMDSSPAVLTMSVSATSTPCARAATVAIATWNRFTLTRGSSQRPHWRDVFSVFATNPARGLSQSR